jgi:hypothetical protein
MRLPEIKGIIERRMLVNFRTSPAVAQAVLPAPFRPQLHRGYAIVGICLIRLGRMRPAGAPSVFGLSSENAAHRIAVEWTDEQGELRQGVYVPRRDTNSWINSTVGGRLFPGQQHRADFQVTDASGRIDFSMLSRDGAVSIRLRAAEHDAFPPKSCFRSLDESSRYFEGGSGILVNASSRPVRRPAIAYRRVASQGFARGGSCVELLLRSSALSNRFD